MSHTNSTTNYALPQFLTSDKPAWLTDINNAFSDIDTAIYNAQTKADTAFNDAGNAQSNATTAINDAAAADAKGSGALASIEAAFDPTTIYSVGAKVIYNSLLYRCTVAVVTPGPWTGSDNWERITVDSLISTTDSKIGSLTSLSTTDKTSAVNAINEVNGGLGNLAALVTPAYLSTITPGANISVSSNTSYRIGKLVVLNCILKVTGNLANNATILSNIPKNDVNAPIRFLRVVGSDVYYGHDDNAGGFNIDANATSLTMFGPLSASAGSPKYLFVNLAYICSIAP